MNDLRPQGLSTFVGQPAVRRHLEIVLRAAKSRGETAGHILFAGPPGLGKTSLAAIVANEMGGRLVTTNGPTLTAKDLVGLLASVREGDVLFVDEIHRLRRQIEEILYPAMEDFVLDIVLDGQAVRLDLPHFTLVGATTREGMLTEPMRDRFAYIGHLAYYSCEDLQAIVIDAGRRYGLSGLSPDAAANIALRSRGTPRVALKNLRIVRDWSAGRPGPIGVAEADEALQLFGVDSHGLEERDREILTALCHTFGGGPVGASTLAAAVGETAETLEEVYEPYLIQQGLLQRSSRGRLATQGTWDYLRLRS